MTTIQHSASRFRFWGYVAAAALAAAVATLLLVTLHDATAGAGTSPPEPTTGSHSSSRPSAQEREYGRACFGLRHTSTIDLARAGCAAGMH